MNIVTIRKKLVLFFVLSLICMFGESKAQETNKGIGGSVYSVYGVGLPLDVAASNFKAQGLFGISGISQGITSLSNPALWNKSFFTQASTGLQLSSFDSKSSSGQNSTSNLASGYVHLLFPIYPGKLGVSLSLYPVTRSNFRVLDSGSFSSATDTVFYSNEVQSLGGVNKFEVGFGLKLTRNISIGYAPSIAFLTLEESQNILFSSSSFTSQDQRRDVSGATFSQRFGISGAFQGLLKEDDRLALGATINLPYTVTSKRKFTTEKLVEGVSQTVDLTSSDGVNEGDITMPFEAGFGLGYGTSRYLDFAFEGSFQKWSEFSNDLKSNEENFMKDRLKIGFGGQFHPYKRNSRKILSKFKYSTGLSYDTGHLSLSGNDISTLWINTGLGIIGRGSARSFPSIDMSFQYGFRGTTDNSLIREQIWSLGFSINLSEWMFVRPKLK